MSTPATTARFHPYSPLTVRIAKDDQAVPSCATFIAIQPHVAADLLLLNTYSTVIPPPTHQRHGRYEADASDCHGPFNPGTRPKTRPVLTPVRLIGSPTVRISFFVGNESVTAKGSQSIRPTTPHPISPWRGERVCSIKKSPPAPLRFCPTA